MNYGDISRYAWFANLAYVKWEKTNNSADNQYNTDQFKMVDAASKDKDYLNTPEALANKIFDEDQLKYSVTSFQRNTASGFAASFYSNEEEKILAIRGTEPTEQLGVDLLSADLQDIGFRGPALYQAVDMVDYLIRLQAKNEIPTVIKPHTVLLPEEVNK